MARPSVPVVTGKSGDGAYAWAEVLVALDALAALEVYIEVSDFEMELDQLKGALDRVCMLIGLHSARRSGATLTYTSGVWYLRAPDPL